ncbi:MAG TPA: hypothetical protein VKW04_10270 [Planctomycetota bacterium]|jgi:hypothetical protein|nr:hypothetical protein [Planctomycetota bacterium]
MKHLQLGAVLAVMAFALLLVVGVPLMAAVTDDAVTGKVTAYESGKTITVQVGDASKEYKITGDTKIEGDVAVGKEVTIEVKETVVTKITVK